MNQKLGVNGRARDSEAGQLVPLFRPEAIEAHKPKLLGEIVLIRPVALSSLVWLASAFVGCALVFLLFGHYTTKTRVTGLLLPDKGVTRLYPPQASILIACNVHEGQRVKKGDVLFELSTDRSSLAFGSTDAEITRELTLRRQSLVNEQMDHQRSSLQQEAGLKDRLRSIDQEQSQLAAGIKVANARLTLAQQVLERYRLLYDQKLISPVQLQEKEAEPLEQQRAVQELNRSVATLERERQTVYSELQSIPLQIRTQSATLDRSISEIDQQIHEHALSRATIVRAPEDGFVSGIVSSLGTTVQPNTSLASFVPAGTKLEAHLYAPSRSIGFIQPGQKVRLHYQAYPSEKFGWQEGVVSEVSSVALSPVEYTFRVGETAQEPMYEITVTIPEQTITFYGQAHLLQVGMVLEGDILLERRRLLEWIFSPLRDLKGRVAA